MIKRFITYIHSLFAGKRKAYSLAIVRRYVDAQGSFVGELYLLGTFAGVLAYQMIGYSLDTLPFDAHTPDTFDLDTEHDFLQPMPAGCVRVGDMTPQNNGAVRKHIAKLATEGTLTLQIQNRFVEHVMQSEGKQ